MMRLVSILLLFCCGLAMASLPRDAVRLRNTLTAVATDGQGHASSHTISVSLASTTSPQYDLNGNLTGDGRRTFTYDAANQLVGIIVTNGPVDSTQTTLGYDGRMRLRTRTEQVWQAGGWTTTQVVRYVYDGNRVLQERDGNNNVLVTYTRGLDLSQSLEGAGGIGGLLARTHPGNHHFYYHSDGNGNVTAIVNQNQTLVAQYRYDPFGNLIAQSGPLAEGNLYRFSSKEFHQASGLYYYGYRFYDPNLQRWLNRDPIQEEGGINLYGFVGNDPINFWDPFGLADPKFYDLRRESKPGDYFYPGRNPGEGFLAFAFRSMSLTAANPSFQGSMAIGGPGSNFGGALNQNLRIKCPASKTAPKVLTLDGDAHPVSAANLEEANAAGVPLSVNRDAASANRKEALSGLQTIPGHDLDEAPPAFLRNPGDPVIVRPTPPGDNRGAGASLGNQTRGVPNGGQVIIVIKRDNQ